MKTVKLLLRENVKDLGKCGDVVQVAAGFARNYLVPQRIAVVASDDNIKLMARRREKLDIQVHSLPSARTPVHAPGHRPRLPSSASFFEGSTSVSSPRLNQPQAVAKQRCVFDVSLHTRLSG